jgi:hypothetical protein
MSPLLHWHTIPASGRSQYPSSIPAVFPKAYVCFSPGQPRDRRRSALCLADPPATLRAISACCLGVLLTLGLPLTSEAQIASRAQALLSSNVAPVVAYAAFITEASRRFAIPERWIRAVMQVESSGNARATSRKGAMGLMQIMPQTWVELSVRYELGLDPFDPHDNIIAGTAYLREMLDRFGSEGFLAAYNAGPKRYEEHLATARPLPDETQTYVARLAPLIGLEQRKRDPSVVRHVVPWQQSALFVEHSGGTSTDGNSTSAARSTKLSKGLPKTRAPALVHRGTGLFVQKSDQVQSR